MMSAAPVRPLGDTSMSGLGAVSQPVRRAAPHRDLSMSS